MPSSNPETIPAIIKVAWQLAPKTVLDVGAGYGKYGVLLREYLELRHSGDDEAILDGKRRVRLDALEGFGRYIGSLHRAIYDEIYVETLQTFLERSWEYELVYMGDVLEHLEGEEAERTVLPELVERATMGLLVSVPAHVMPQSAVFGNELEVHRSTWSAARFRGAAPYAHIGRYGSHLLAFLSRDKGCCEEVRGNLLKRKLRRVLAAVTDSW